MNIESKVHIEEEGSRKVPKLLSVTIDRHNGKEEVSSNKEIFFEETGCTWKDDKKKSVSDIYKELRQHDKVDLIFPREPTWFVGDLDTGYFSHSELLINLKKGVNYKIDIQIVGEDSDKLTVRGNKTVTLMIP